MVRPVPQGLAAQPGVIVVTGLLAAGGMNYKLAGMARPLAFLSDRKGRRNFFDWLPSGRFVARIPFAPPPVKTDGAAFQLAGMNLSRHPFYLPGPDAQGLVDPMYRPGMNPRHGIFRLAMGLKAGARKRDGLQGVADVPRFLRWPTMGGAHVGITLKQAEATANGATESSYMELAPGEVYDLGEIQGDTSQQNPLEQIDSDGDGLNNFADRDDDGDGVGDDREQGQYIYDAAENHDNDGDGTGDVRDDDDDNDGLPDRLDQDDDGDGIPDAKDTDDDGDGVEDATDLEDFDFDLDEDGLPDEADSDDDGDGVADAVDADQDNDGVPDDRDGDDDNDGVRDAQEAADTDSDGIADAVDPAPEDSNVREIAANVDWKAWARKYRDDRDGDYIPDAQDADDDGDGTPDAQDTDNDNDGIPDAQDRDRDEDGMPDALEAKGPDADGDGVGDAYDTDPDGDGTLASAPDEGEAAADADEDGVPDVEDDQPGDEGAPSEIAGRNADDDDGAIVGKPDEGEKDTEPA